MSEQNNMKAILKNECVGLEFEMHFHVKTEIKYF